MEIYQSGTLVIIKLANIKGMITCCAIRFDKTTYEVTYYCGTDQKVVWLHENEFETEDQEKQQIGFKK
jgi:hypothetical protein